MNYKEERRDIGSSFNYFSTYIIYSTPDTTKGTNILRTSSEIVLHFHEVIESEGVRERERENK